MVCFAQDCSRWYFWNRQRSLVSGLPWGCVVLKLKGFTGSRQSLYRENSKVLAEAKAPNRKYRKKFKYKENEEMFCG